jgi:hypothetical protein
VRSTATLLFDLMAKQISASLGAKASANTE